MRYFYFVLAVYPQKTTGFPVFENIFEFESDEPLDSLESLRRASDRVKSFIGEPGAIIHSFQFLRAESDEADGIKIPDPTAWDNFPEWANYKTMDKNGEIWAWEEKPDLGGCEWRSGGRTTRVAILENPERYDWTKMIEKRPK